MIRRTLLEPAGWRAVAANTAPALIGLWADAREVHALLDGPVLVSVEVRDGSYPAMSAGRPEAASFERAVRDLWGHRAEGGDGRAWFPAHAWPVAHPMSARPVPQAGRDEVAEPGEVAEDRHVAVCGPIRAGLGEPVVVRTVLDGRVIESAEVQAGFAHKGTMLLMRGRTPRAAAVLAARLQAEAAVAHGIAFARAAEDACGVSVPARAEALRAAMAAVEDVAGSVAALRGRVARAGPVVDGLRRSAGLAFGHRLMMDCIVPGGVLAEVTPDGVAGLLAALIGAAGCGVAVEAAREALDRLAALAPGPIAVGLPTGSGEGLGHVMTARGAIWHWVRLEQGVIVDAFALDPAWRGWTAFTAGLVGRPVETGDGVDVPGVSGMDL